MLTKKSALSLVLEKWSPKPPIEIIPMEESQGRVLAQDVFARYTSPVVRSAMMDSVALISNRFSNGMPDTTMWKRGVDYDIADMGDDFNDRFDCAVPVERVTFADDGTMTIHKGPSIKAGIGIRQRGSTVKENDLLLSKGRRLVSVDLAVLAIGGISQVAALKKPIVAFIPTGSELVPRGQAPGRGQTTESNSIMIEAMLREMGAEPVCFPIVRDSMHELSDALDKALACADIVVLGGGSSMGEEDFTAQLLKSRGELLFQGVAAAPGRPLGAAIIDKKPVVNLPGPPAAAFAVTDWCVRAMVAHALGTPIIKRREVKALLTETLETPQQMEFTTRVIVRKSPDGRYLAAPVPMGSAPMVQIVGADGVFISPIGQSVFEKGTHITVELLCGEVMSI